MSDSDLPWNLWGAVAGAIGILLAPLPFFTVWLYKRLPSSRLPGLIELMDETQRLFASALREELITSESELARFRLNIMAATIRAERIRAKVYAESSFVDNVVNWWRGLSSRMYFLEAEFKHLRVKLAERNSKEREKRASEGLMTGFLCLPGDREHALPASALETPPRIDHDGSVPSACHDTPGGAAAGSDTDGVRVAPTCYSCTPQRQTFTDSEPHPPPGHRPTHFVVSDADLQSLLFIALAPAPVLTAEGRRRQAAQKEAFLHLSRQVYGLDLSALDGGAKSAKRKIKCGSHFKSLARLLKRIYGVRSSELRGDGEGQERLIDPESLLPQYAEDDDDDDDDDDDGE